MTFKPGLLIFFLSLVLTPVLHSASGEEEKSYTEEGVELQIIRVIPGDTLHAISGVYLKDPSRWPELLKYNSIPTKDPDLILPGMKLLVPVSYIKESMRAAILILKKQDVRFRRRGEPDWNETAENMKLYFEDTIRTMGESECRVQFATKDVLKISENSLVILRPEELTQEVQLLKGKVLASKARVLTDAAVIEPKQDATLFEAKIRDDKTTEVNVWKGEVNVKGGGEELVIGAGFATEVKLETPPLTPWKLPVLSEEKIEEMTLDLKPLSVQEMAQPQLESVGSFKPDAVDWEKMQGTLEAPSASPQKKIGKVTIYRVQIAIDRTFSDIIFDGEVAEAKIRVKSYPDGRYYWRMAGVDAAGNIGNYSSVKTFLLDRRPPAFDVIYPPADEKISEEFVEVRGKTEFGCKAFVDGIEVIVDREGFFRRIIYIPLGKYVINIRVIDKNGKEFTVSRTVERTQKEKKGFLKGIFGK